MIKRAVYAIPAIGMMWGGCGGVEARATCGDAFTDEGEECDDGNDVDGDSCTNACTVATCGDGITETAAEQCDDGNNIDSDDCTNACEPVRCGDGVLADQASGQAREACDDGNADDTDGCLVDCEIDPVIRAFTITKHRNLEPTAQYVHYFQSGYNSTFCSRAFDSPVSISMALVASGSYTRTRDCVENTEDNVVTREITGTAEILIARQKYNITLTETGGGPIILDCDMDAATKLVCVDNATPPTSWELTPQ
jgi:cysteine-rich repeat protein